MAQRVFTFTSPVSVNETIDIISRVVSVLRGTTSISGNMITAKWRSKRYQTFFPKKFTFYVGEDYVRVIMKEYSDRYNVIKWDFDCYCEMRIWDDFVFTLRQMFPHLDFGLCDSRFHIVSAKFLSDGVEQSFYSSSYGSSTITGSVVNYTSGQTRTVLSNEVLATVRYSNGLVLEGRLSKKSKVYNRILVDMSKLNN